MKSPFPYFGGKKHIADIVWKKFGTYIKNFVDPFCGSCSILLNRPFIPEDSLETINDINGLLCNFWRSMTKEPDKIYEYANWPINELDLHARHLFLKNRHQLITEKLIVDPEYYDVKLAGWFVWVISTTLGSEFGKKGTWVIKNGRLVKGVVKRGIFLSKPYLTSYGNGVNTKTPLEVTNFAKFHLDEIAKRIRRVRVLCGDWKRTVTPSVTSNIGNTAVFLDPPYGDIGIDTVYLYDSKKVNLDVLKWCLENSDNKKLRIALCGYVGQYEILHKYDWKSYKWTAIGGYGNQSKTLNDNNHREIVWFSPNCL